MPDHLGLKIFLVALLLVGCQLMALPATSSEPLTSGQAISIAQEQIENDPLYADIDLGQPPSAENITCRGSKHSYDCSSTAPHAFEEQSRNFWVLGFSFKNEKTVQLDIGPLDKFWLLLDPYTSRLVGRNVVEAQWLATYLLAKVRHDFNEKMYSGVIQAGYFLYWRYGKEAEDQNRSLSEYVWTSREDIIRYRLMNYLGESLFLMGEASYRQGDHCQAKKFFRTLIDRFGFAQVWDPQGWFWKPAEAARQRLDEIEDRALCPDNNCGINKTAPKAEAEKLTGVVVNNADTKKANALRRRSLIHTYRPSFYAFLWSLATAVVLAGIFLRCKYGRKK